MPVTLAPDNQAGFHGARRQLVHEERKRIRPTKDLDNLFLSHDAHTLFSRRRAGAALINLERMCY